MLAKGMGVREKARTSVTPLIGVGVVAVLEGENSGGKVDGANTTIVLAVIVVHDEELAATLHLGS